VKLGKIVLLMVWLLPAYTMADQVKVTPLLTKDLDQFPGKEGMLVAVEYPPGAYEPEHRHNAYVFVYVVEGKIVMQVRGGQQVTLSAGQTFYEAPDVVHVVGRNASKTNAARFIAFFIKNKGAPTHMPLE
jgi:quercetin dioxygenase-like cupin family protein